MGKLSSPLLTLIERVKYHATKVAAPAPSRLLAGISFEVAPTQRIVESRDLPLLWCDVPDVREGYGSNAGRGQRIESGELAIDFRLSVDRAEGLVNAAGKGLMDWAERVADAMNSTASDTPVQDVTLDGLAARPISIAMVEGAAFEKSLEITLRVTVLSKPFTANSRKT